MKVFVDIERKDIDKPFGNITIESLAASIYNSFHGHCECAAHPFYWSDNGDFHGTLPWSEGRRESGDSVVQAFRLAALAAYDALKGTGIGSLK